VWRENVEIVRRFVDAYNRRDADAVLGTLHPNVEWHTRAGAILGVEAVQGETAVLSFLFDEVPGFMLDFQAVTEEVTELCNDQVLWIGRYEGRGEASGAAVTMDSAAIYRLDAGAIMFFQDYPTRQEAFEAIGLKE
jgi:ketosteroid isomerase-like protein